ncbi:MAG: hypothetical protein M1825_003019 [Sarcosagium campestre]|nr:MAG: hypothetical protein M1825_003019 [Sarcosagium campestre]
MVSGTKRQKLSVDGVAPVTKAGLSADVLVDGSPLYLKSGDIETEEDDPDLPRKSTKKAQLARQLFVRSLPATTTNESLTAFFSDTYPLKHATVVIDPATKQSKGYGFVTFADADDAQNAIRAFDGALFEGRKIRVEAAEPRHRESGDGEGPKTSLSVASASAKAERAKSQIEARKPPKLIVRNLPWSIKDADQLSMLFRSYGKIKHAAVPRTKSGLLAGFGFVLIRGKKNAEKAIAGVNGKVVDGRTLEVTWAVDKNDSLSSDAEGRPLIETGDNAGAKENHDADAPLSDDGSAPEGAENITDEDSYAEDMSQSSSEEQSRDNSSTVFIRNLPFTITDESLFEHFKQFGAVRYARIVIDRATERPKGTGFVCFYNQADADSCLKAAPREAAQTSRKGDQAMNTKFSILQNERADTSGQFTIEGRVLQITRAVNHNEAAKLTEQNSEHRDRRDRDKRRLYLLSEGTIPAGSPLFHQLSPSEIQMREASMKQRKTLIKNNASLHLSLTRLSVRNIPRGITSKDLKALAREAVVGFAKDVKEQVRAPLSKEENARGGEAMKLAERARKLKGKGIVKQATIVFEGREGGKVSEQSGAGRSRGYGFIEYSSHRWALMGLRWLNGRPIGPAKDDDQIEDKSGGDDGRRKKRLVIEFAIENAQVVARRNEREVKDRERPKSSAAPPDTGGDQRRKDQKSNIRKNATRNEKSKRDRSGFGSEPTDSKGHDSAVTSSASAQSATAPQTDLAKRQQIIEKKRMRRRSRKMGAAS